MIDPRDKRFAPLVDTGPQTDGSAGKKPSPRKRRMSHCSKMPSRGDWFVLAACTFILFAALGIYYSFGIFFRSLQMEFLWSRAGLSAGRGRSAGHARLHGSRLSGKRRCPGLPEAQGLGMELNAAEAASGGHPCAAEAVDAFTPHGTQGIDAG